jgi:AcrR family transcriptional regulator
LAKKIKRIRRRPEEARAQILGAAETIMAKGAGPASLRLQDVANAAGLSHPTILHHFGSREGLVRALNLRAFEKLTEATVSGMAADSSRDNVAKTFAAYRNGLAQRMIWLMQSESQPKGRPVLFDQVVERLHQFRGQFAKPGAEPDIADTRAIVHLVTVAAFGDALMGARLRQEGSKEVPSRQAFERWLSALVDMFVGAKASA